MALLLLHAGLALYATVSMSCTVDELPHLTAGHSYWSHQAYHLHSENGMLPQRWAALPAVLGDLRPPNPQHVDWHRSDVWTIGLDYLYNNTASPEAILLNARTFSLVWNLGLGLLIFCWARSLFGRNGAFFALGLFAVCPVFLANGPLVTSDACACFLLLAAIGAFWRHLHHNTLGTLLLSVLCLGLCCVAKFNAALLLPLFILLLLLAWLAHRAGHEVALFRQPARSLGLGLLSHLSGAVFVIWLFFGFGTHAPPPFQTHYFGWEEIRQGIGWKAGFLQWISAHHLLPDDYLRGFGTVLHMAQQRGAFLNGECSTSGWISFFPYAFLAKTTLTLLVITLLLLVWKAASLRNFLKVAKLRDLVGTRTYHCLPLLVFFALFWASSLTLKLNIGHRHILPVYPVLYILAGGLGAWLLARPGLAPRLLAGLLLVSQAVECARIAPHFLAHFNPLVGGPAQGYRQLVDSSLDWGQDLPGLQDWLDQDQQARAGAPVYLAYFGSAPIPHHVPKAGILVNLMRIRVPGDAVLAKPGLYCISATLLQQSYMAPRDWSVEFERSYQLKRHLAQELLSVPRYPRTQTVRESEEQREFIRGYEYLRFRRLAAYLRRREPDAMVGYSILIYRLDEKALHAALYGPWSEWARDPDPR